MKDLFKGHHPWLLVLVIAVDIFSALVIRHSILSKGESEFNANVFFCLIIIGGLALYAILVEFLSGKDMPLIGENKEKEEKVKAPPQPLAPESSSEQTPPSLEQTSVSRNDLEQIMRNVMSDLKREVAVPTGATITKDEDGIVSVNINEMKKFGKRTCQDTGRCQVQICLRVHNESSWQLYQTTTRSDPSFPSGIISESFHTQLGPSKF